MIQVELDAIFHVILCCVFLVLNIYSRDAIYLMETYLFSVSWRGLMYVRVCLELAHALLDACFFTYYVVVFVS